VSSLKKLLRPPPEFYISHLMFICFTTLALSLLSCLIPLLRAPWYISLVIDKLALPLVYSGCGRYLEGPRFICLRMNLISLLNLSHGRASILLKKALIQVLFLLIIDSCSRNLFIVGPFL
jgi:hypothetical protein